jgi:hypothetical protein
MALKKNEKTLVGVALMAAGVAVVFAFGLPQWDAFSSNNSQLGSLNEDIKNLDAQKTNLGTQISLLQKNTDVPAGITIRTYNDQTREKIIKSLLDQVVGLATGAGNKFISLVPSDVAPVLPPVQPAKTPDQSAAKATITETTANSPNAASATPGGATATTTAGATATASTSGAPAPSAPVLDTFGYDLTIRGSYNTVQGFLRAMDAEKELLEIGSITLENEARGYQPDADRISDPNYPIRLTARIRIALQPVK